MIDKVSIFDSTLRDGAQAEGISFTVEDKIKIVRILDNLGIDYIEAGNPGSNPKDLEFFRRVGEMGRLHSKIAAFGSTRRKGIAADEDKNLHALVDSGVECIVIFGKSWDFQVIDILNAELDENLEMIGDTIRYLKDRSKEVIFDAEHFFDGYIANPEYAMNVLLAAKDAGADTVVLCDTNGGCFPDDIYMITKTVVETLRIKIGVHTHNDCGMAVANSIMAVKAGASHVQGTFIGFGERCGNASLSTIIPNLQIKKNIFKKNISCIPDDKLKMITSAANKIAEVANISLFKREPYVGSSAFTHKGGMHIDAVGKNPRSFEHVDPESVGNARRLLTSEVAGRSTILSKIRKFDPGIDKNSPETDRIIDILKDLEHQGYQFEGADSSFELIIRKQLGKYKPFFELVNFKTIGERPYIEGSSASALIKIIVDGRTEITAAEGNGPVNALDRALRKALEVFYPELSKVYLLDYKVRVLDSTAATASKVRVLIDSTDGTDIWTTVGVSKDIIEASWTALVDSIEYKLIKDIEHKFKAYL